MCHCKIKGVKHLVNYAVVKCIRCCVGKWMGQCVAGYMTKCVILCVSLYVSECLSKFMAERVRQCVELCVSQYAVNV